MKKITVILDDETEKKFHEIRTIRASNRKWQKLPTYKEIMIDAMELLYQKEKHASTINSDDIGVPYGQD